MAGLLVYFRITSIIVEKISGSSLRRGFHGLSGIAERELDGPARDEVLAVIGLVARIGWRMMRAAAWLMPRAAGTRWLAEASGFLPETPPAQWRRVVRSYLRTAPALALLDRALGHDPHNEQLYQRIMQIQARLGRADAVGRTLRLLEARLADIGAKPGQSTYRLASEMQATAPGTATTVGSADQ